MERSAMRVRMCRGLAVMGMVLGLMLGVVGRAGEETSPLDFIPDGLEICGGVFLQPLYASEGMAALRAKLEAPENDDAAALKAMKVFPDNIHRAFFAMSFDAGEDGRAFSIYLEMEEEVDAAALRAFLQGRRGERDTRTVGASTAYPGPYGGEVVILSPTRILWGSASMIDKVLAGEEVLSKNPARVKAVHLPGRMETLWMLVHPPEAAIAQMDWMARHFRELKYLFLSVQVGEAVDASLYAEFPSERRARDMEVLMQKMIPILVDKARLAGYRIEPVATVDGNDALTKLTTTHDVLSVVGAWAVETLASGLGEGGIVTPAADPYDFVDDE